jgi:hypothetical protein
MQGSLDHPPIVLAFKPGPITRLIAVLPALLLMPGLYCLLTAFNPKLAGAAVELGLFGVAFIAFAGVGLVLGFSALVSPPRLEIGPQGVLQKSFGSRRRYDWADVENFRPISIKGPVSKAVGFDMPDAKPSAQIEMFRTNFGIDAALPVYELEPSALAELLTSARARWVGGPQRRTEPLVPPGIVR